MNTTEGKLLVTMLRQWAVDASTFSAGAVFRAAADDIDALLKTSHDEEQLGWLILSEIARLGAEEIRHSYTEPRDETWDLLDEDRDMRARMASQKAAALIAQVLFGQNLTVSMRLFTIRLEKCVGQAESSGRIWVKRCAVCGSTTGLQCDTEAPEICQGCALRERLAAATACPFCPSDRDSCTGECEW